MGIEYRISCSSDALPQLADFLLTVGGQSHSQAAERIDFLLDSTSLDSLAYASVTLEHASLYFCDHGGPREATAMLFRRIVDKAITFSDGRAVTITYL